MGHMGSSRSSRRVRRKFSDEFMAGAVRLVLDEGKTIGAVARDLDLTPSSLANWVRHARADRTKGRTGLTTEERAELAQLRKENRELRTEREILKKAAAFFAKEHATSRCAPSSRRCAGAVRRQGCCTTVTRAARTRARITSASWPRTGISCSM